MKGIGASIKKHQKAIGIGMTVLGGAILAAGAKSVQTFAKMGDEVQKMALRTGFSTEALSELRHAAELSGTSLSSLEKASKTLSGAILDAGFGLETYVRALGELGLTYEELVDLSPEDQFLAVMEALAGVEDESKRAALAADLFGRAGTQLLPIMASGTQGLADMRQEAHDLGIVFDQEAANKAAAFNDALTKLKGSVTGVMIEVGSFLVDALKPLIDNITNVIKKVVDWTKEHPGLSKVITLTTIALAGLLIVVGTALIVGPKLVAVLAAMRVGFPLMLGPLGWLLAAITAVIWAISQLVGNSKRLTAQMAAEAKAEELSARLKEEHAKAIEGLDNEYLNLLREAKELGFVIGEQQEAFLQAAETQAAYRGSVNATTSAINRQIAAAKRLTGTMRANVAGAVVSLAMLRTQRNLTPAEQEQLRLLGERIGAPGLQMGGIVTKPTLAMIGERGPEAVVPLERGGMMGGFKTANIDVQIDGHTIIRVIGQPLVDEIRLRTGAQF